jgi:hypothetical protein
MDHHFIGQHSEGRARGRQYGGLSSADSVAKAVKEIIFMSRPTRESIPTFVSATVTP